MKDLLWRTARDGQMLQVSLREGHELGSVEGFAAFDLGPVVATREVDGFSAALGDAETLGAALERWAVLREVGDEVTCTWIGDLDTIAEYLATELRLAPPEGWETTPDKFFSVPVNGDSVDDLDLQDMPWEGVASCGSEYGGNNLYYWCGWYWDRKTDMEDEFFWAGTEPNFEDAAWEYVLNPPMWPSGETFSVNLPFVTESNRTEATERLARSEIAKWYSAIELNDVMVWEAEPSVG